MANLINLQPYGNQIRCIFDDGSSVMAYPTPGGLWLVGVGGPAPIPPPNPGDHGIVIYPTIQHTVVDFDGSFAGHQQRTPPSVNPGCDYAPLNIGNDVYAVADGVVTNADGTYGGSGGATVHIDHSALNTSSDYLHLSVVNVNNGQTVHQGDVIALSGASADGSANGVGAHLHISYRNSLDHMYQNYNNIDFDAYIKSLP